MTHILVFHLVAWKLFFALQADDWFVRLLKLPIQELDDTTRSRNSMKGNCVDFIISKLVAYIINVFWYFFLVCYHFILYFVLYYFFSYFIRLNRYWYYDHEFSDKALQHTNNVRFLCQRFCCLND